MNKESISFYHNRIYAIVSEHVDGTRIIALYGDEVNQYCEYLEESLEVQYAVYELGNLIKKSSI